MKLNFSHTRQPGDQPLISRVADHFLTPRDKSLLSRFLGGQSPRYTLDELQSLIVRTPEFFPASATGDISVKNPIAAMYLFALTIDHYLNYIRQLEFKLQNMNNLDSMSVEKQALDHEILAPDFRIWPFHDQAPWSGGYSQDQKPADVGEGLGVERLIVNGRWIQKSNQALALDERMILYYNALHILASLTQGLYLIEVKKDAKWCNHGGTTLLAARNRSIRTAALITTTGTDLSYLHVKLGAALKTFCDKSQEIVDIHGDTAGTTKPANGGAVSFFTFAPQPQITTTAEVQTHLDAGDAFPVGDATAMTAAITAPNGSWYHKQPNLATKTSWSKIVEAMAAKTDGIQYCPKLSEAFIQSGVNLDLRSIYYELQKMYMQRRNMTTLGITPQNALEFMNYRNKSDGYASTFNCGPGMTPRFIGHDGKNVDLKDAVITRNGRQYVNTALVDPDRSYCTAVIPVAKFNSLLSKPFPDAWNDKYGISASAPIPFDAKAMLLEDRGPPMAPMSQGPSGPMPRDPQGSMFGPEIVLHDPYGDAAAAAAAMEARYGGKKKKKKTKGGKKKKGAGRKKKCSYK